MHLSKQLEDVQQKLSLTPAEIMHSYFIENKGRNSLDAISSYIERLSSDHDRTVKESAVQIRKSNRSNRITKKKNLKHNRCYMGQSKHTVWKIKTTTHYAHTARLAYQKEFYAYCDPEDRRRSYEHWLWVYKLTRQSTGWKAQSHNKYQYEKRAQYHFSADSSPYKEISKKTSYKQYVSDFSPDEIDTMLYEDYLKNLA